MKKAKWLTDYDMHNDKCFDRPQCPECHAPIFEHDEGEFRCISCNEQFELDEKMIEWVRSRQGSKVEMQDCHDTPFEWKGETIHTGCGGTKCVEVHYRKNPMTLEWQVAWGECKKCGMRFIV